MNAHARTLGPLAMKDKAAGNENNRRAILAVRGFAAQGKTLQQIADELNGAGFRIARGGEFIRKQVSRILTRL